MVLPVSQWSVISEFPLVKSAYSCLQTESCYMTFQSVDKKLFNFENGLKMGKKVKN